MSEEELKYPYTFLVGISPQGVTNFLEDSVINEMKVGGKDLDDWHETKRNLMANVSLQLAPVPEPLTEEQFNLGDSVMAGRFITCPKREWTYRLVNGVAKWVHAYFGGSLAIADWSDLIEPSRVEDGA